VSEKDKAAGGNNKEAAAPLAASAPAARPAHIRLGGRFFRVVDLDRRTVLQDHYLHSRVRALGIDKLLPGEAETDLAYLVRMQDALIDSGRAHEIIAAFLMPQGTDEAAWTPAIAADTAAHIGACNTPEDRGIVMALAVQACFGFFRQGLEQLERFRASLADPSPQPKDSSALLH